MLEENTAGSPTVPGLKWTHLTVTEIAAKLLDQGIKVARKVIVRLLKKMGFKNRKQVKSKTKAPSRNRDEQFNVIHKLRNNYVDAGDPCLSLDSKRKEFLGETLRAGSVIANQAAEVLDHDLPAYHDGEVTPHGIYDVANNSGHVNVTTGSDTGEFACASLKQYWYDIGSERYPNAERMLLFCDCGGSNSYRSNTFKHFLQELANDIGLSIQVAHYPVHCSKYNLIERRLFCHVERALSGHIFESAAEVMDAIDTTSTRSGLEVTVGELGEFTPVKRSGKTFAEPAKIEYGAILPEYNYTLHPQDISA